MHADLAHRATIRKNVRAIADLELRALHQRGVADRLSDAVTRATGSAPFALFHVVWFSACVRSRMSRCFSVMMSCKSWSKRQMFIPSLRLLRIAFRTPDASGGVVA